MRKKAFTLMEIIVVLAIMAVILGLGINMFISMSKSTTMTEATGDVISILKETQNMAKNNNLPKTETAMLKAQSVYYYVVEFKSSATSPYGNINRYLFRKKSGVWDTSPTNPIQTESGIKSKALSNIVNYQKDTSECSYVMFENLTGRIFVSKGNTQATLNAENTYNEPTTDCKLTVNLATDSNFKKQIYINAANGTFGIVGETK
jgi:prepilin-type N-terminal cleavage/methylation domain-containing protein